MVSFQSMMHFPSWSKRGDIAHRLAISRSRELIYLSFDRASKKARAKNPAASAHLNKTSQNFSAWISRWNPINKKPAPKQRYHHPSIERHLNFLCLVGASIVDTYETATNSL